MIDFVGHLGHWGYLVIFIVVALECQALLGLFMPGESLVLVGGFFAEQRLLDLRVLIFVISSAAVLGDSITSCPACDLMWRQYYPEWAKKLGIDYQIKTRHYSEILAEQIQAIPNVKFVEMDHNREQAHCCASVLTLLKEPPVAADIGKVRLDEALAAGAEKILSLCPCCQVQLRVTADKKGLPIEVQDLAHFATATFGYTFPDPNPAVRKQWAVFEAFIKLLTPQGFADLMGTMWPELIEAMPFGMGGMMRFLGKAPGALSLMKPMFPVLFPRLLPLMLPKVMGNMLRRVEEQIEMPTYMREQMPDLMPKIMDRLMPHIIGDVVPLITQPMTDYLQGKS